MELMLLLRKLLRWKAKRNKGIIWEKEGSDYLRIGEDFKEK